MQTSSPSLAKSLRTSTFVNKQAHEAVRKALATPVSLTREDAADLLPPIPFIQQLLGFTAPTNTRKRVVATEMSGERAMWLETNQRGGAVAIPATNDRGALRIQPFSTRRVGEELCILRCAAGERHMAKQIDMAIDATLTFVDVATKANHTFQWPVPRRVRPSSWLDGVLPWLLIEWTATAVDGSHEITCSLIGFWQTRGHVISHSEDQVALQEHGIHASTAILPFLWFDTSSRRWSRTVREALTAHVGDTQLDIVERWLDPAMGLFVEANSSGRSST